MKSKLLTMTLVLLFATVASWAQTTYFVKADGNSGTSWKTAFVTLQQALTTATSGDQIWIAAGTYKPTQQAGNGTENRDMAFVLKAGVKIYGGFAGNETALDQRQLSILNYFEWRFG